MIDVDRDKIAQQLLQQARGFITDPTLLGQIDTILDTVQNNQWTRTQPVVDGFYWARETTRGIVPVEVSGRDPIPAGTYDAWLNQPLRPPSIPGANPPD